MKSIYYTFFAVAISFTSCKNNETEKPAVDPRTVVPFTQQGATSLQNQTQQTPVVQKNNLFHENNPVSAPSVASGINPAHGQPNHRCDIPVGAPLNSPVNNTNVTTTQTSKQTSVQPTKMITNVTPTKVVTPKGMNPPHGEPGHRCDISVGAPLDSKPNTTATTTSAGEPVKQETKQPAVPALLAPNPVETTTPKE